MIAGLEPWAQDALRVGSGLATGALIGIERGFNLRGQREGTRVAGVRTFSLLGLGSGVAGLFSAAQPFAAGAILVAMLGYLAIAYAPKLKAKPDATSPPNMRYRIGKGAKVESRRRMSKGVIDGHLRITSAGSITHTSATNSTECIINNGGRLTFAAGETSKSVTVQAIGDAADETDETFTLLLSQPDRATIADDQGVATIVDDDAPDVAPTRTRRPSRRTTRAS